VECPDFASGVFELQNYFFAHAFFINTHGCFCVDVFYFAVILGTVRREDGFTAVNQVIQHVPGV
jgi:hypothetical protein